MAGMPLMSNCSMTIGTFFCELPAVAHGCTKRRFAAKQFIENNQLRYSMQSAGLLRYPRLLLQH